MFQPVDPKQSFPKMEEALIALWKKNRIFEKSVDQRKKDYVFYDGPPFATGLPHYGHLLAGTLKDVVPRYWTMQGYRIERVWGWDCHGLPIENLIEKELGLKSKKDIEKMGIDKFNEVCRASVLKYAEEWEKTVERMGRWVDFEHSYKTMDVSFMESVWWVFKELWKKKMVYEGNRNMLVCPRCVTPLSNFEASLNYKEITDNSIAVKMFLTPDSAKKILPKAKKPIAMIPWTTTPWTLPANLAIYVGPNIVYALIEEENEYHVIAEQAIPLYYKKEEAPNIVKRLKGSEFKGLEYDPIFPYHPKAEYQKNHPNAYRILVEEIVKADEGTGVVHSAVSYGDETDFEIATRNNLPFIHHVLMDGTFAPYIKEFSGLYWKDAEDKVAEVLKKRNWVIRYQKYKHSYPHCWRCESPLIYYTRKAWFVNVEKIKSKMLKNNQKIHWVPSHIKEGRFGKWLENAHDWCISRNRYWGTPLPIWRNTEDPEDWMVLGSAEELENLSSKKVSDLHKHIVDAIEIRKGKKNYRRIEEVFDCWFESGSMPYGQWHYPFENKKQFEKTFPANYIGEGLDQTRGWFYTLHVLSTALFEKPAFKNVIVNGIVLAENGQKMSKRLKNYPDPHEVLNKYGADALRFYLLNSQAVVAGDLRFSERGVEHVLKNMMIPLWNAYSFFVTYAAIDGWTAEKFSKNSPHKLDTWIRAELSELVAGQIEYFRVYDLQKASNAIYKFVDDLTNWYIRRCRRRFWKSEDDTDKNHAYSTLYEVLTKLAQVLAPFTPFMPEEMYRNLTGEESVHLTDYPKPDKKVYDETLIHEIHLAKTIVSLGLAARAKKKIKVRQPLQKMEVVLKDPADHALLADQVETIKEELNIKEVDFIDDPSEFATRVAKPNAKLLGPKYGGAVQQIILACKNGEFEELGNGNLKVLDYELLPDEVTIEYLPKGDFDVEAGEGILVALSTTVTPELRQEGLARDLVRQIQDLRKKAGYKVSDRIKVSLQGVDQALLQKFGDYIKTETLAVAFEASLDKPDQSVELEGLTIQVKRLK